MNHLLRNIELYLSGAGLLVILLVPTLLAPLGMEWMTIAAITAALVGVLHGLIFWLIRQRQRRVRRKALGDIRMMLRDVINNKLLVVSVGLSASEFSAAERQQALDQCHQAIDEITQALNHISEESLTIWQRKYGLEETDGEEGLLGRHAHRSLT